MFMSIMSFKTIILTCNIRACLMYNYNAFYYLNIDVMYDSAFDVKLYFVIQDINFDL